jgi:ribosomal protein S18 acetylase RimI-like enzyme
VEEVRIRTAEPDDVAALSALARRTWSEAFGEGVSAGDETAELEEGRSESYFSGALGRETILVAEADGHLVGYVQFGNVNIPEVESRQGDQSLQRLYVETSLQRRGLGGQLLAAAMQHPRLVEARRIFLTVWEKNERAVQLYERHGFRRVGTTTFSVGTAVMEDLVMLLDRAAHGA